MPEPLALPSYDDLDELVDTDPIRLRDKAWQLRCEAARLAEDLKRATEVVAAIRQVTGGGYLPPAWSYKWRERAETAEAEVERLKAENELLRRLHVGAENSINAALDLAARLDPTCGHTRERAFIADLLRILTATPQKAVSG